MRHPDRELISEVASEVRQAMTALSAENSRATRWIRGYYRQRTQDHSRDFAFPNQWCSFASVVLAGHLARTFKDTQVTLLKGTAADGGVKHWWLSFQGFTIDITRDQFAGEEEAYCVTENTRWHVGAFPDPSATNVFQRTLGDAGFERLTACLACEVRSSEIVREGETRRWLRKKEEEAREGDG